MHPNFFSFKDLYATSGLRYFSFFAGLGILLVINGCGQQDEQREFEEDAYQIASGITETDNSGNVIGNRDPDDWRISPFFDGLAIIDEPLPHPNPVLTNEPFYIDFRVSGIESINGLYIFVVGENRLRDVYSHEDISLPAGHINIQLNPLEFGQFQQGQNVRGLYRIILFDQRNNIISYGDIRVE